MLQKSKRHSLKPSLLIITVYIGLLAFLPYASSQQVQDSSSLKYEVESAISAELTHSIQVDNPTFEGISNGILFVPIVKNETAHHYVILCNITSTKGQPRFISDSFGNTYAYWSNLLIESGQIFNVRIDYYVLSFGIHRLIDSNLIIDYDRSSDSYITYTQPEELAQCDAPEIISKARSLTEEVLNIHDKVFRIYSFVTSHLQYARQERERGALWALQNGTGDCSEYAYLFVALCRAAGIPARIQTGFGFRLSDEKTRDGHMWTEYYLQNYGWIPVDPTWKLFDKIDEKHFGSMKSMPEITPYANYFFNYTDGPDQSAIRHSQEILLKPSSMNLFGSELVSNTLKAVRTVTQARTVISLERLFGMPTMFPSETEKVDRLLLMSQMHLQNALEDWRENPQIVHSYILEAHSMGDEALQKAWILVGYALAIFGGALIAIALVSWFFVRRRQTKPREIS